eukprot:CAMPEP_0172667108 /NCGR_PEP_ID=MMETSP1074-20121228/8215_1 /TAXON_ID=2916 /ORGANISM="Ceratium fusus, Strain PA161109" /LENGTH=988 /DNA_ID=CAMNT_0013483571 /DNA_START=32 /DNA_END=2998 /DNA_ORIENTATION=-
MTQDEGTRRPLELIRIDNHGKCHVQERAADIISQLHGKLAVVGVAGLYRTGKSFLLNRLLGSQTGFEIGGTVNACTKGIWVWGEPIEIERDYHCLLLDTEGLGSAQRTASCDMQILSLCVLLCSNFIYNSMGSIDEQAIDDLHLVLHLAKHIHARSCDGDIQRASALKDYFPHFLWVLRDFHLRLVDGEGQSISEKQYLESSLSSVPGHEDKNRLRNVIKELFKMRDCATLVRPLVNEEELRNIHRVPYESLRPQFRQQTENFVTKVFDELQPKAIQGTFVSGPAFVALATEYCKAINASAVPTIQSAWSSAVQEQLRLCQRNAIHIYQAGFQQEMHGKLPMSEDKLHDMHKVAKARAMDAFLTPRLDEATPKLHECRSDTASRIKQIFEDAKEENRSASKLLCESVAVDLYKTRIECKLLSTGHDSFQSVELLMHSWEQLRQEYTAATAGPSQGEVLSVWLFQQMAESVQKLSSNLQRAADGRYGRLKQKYSVVEHRRRRSESVERLLLAVPTMTERHLIPTLTEQVRCYQDAVVKRRAGLAAVDDLHGQMLSYQWRLRVIENQLATADTATSHPSAVTRSRSTCSLVGSVAGIRQQCEEVMATLGEYGTHHVLSPPGLPIRRAEAEHQNGVELLQKLATETFEEVTTEMRQLISGETGNLEWSKIAAVLQDRQRRCRDQLDEACAGWREASNGVQPAGEEVLRAWSGLAAAADGLVYALCSGPGRPQPALLQALSSSAARVMEVELVDSAGLDGLESSDAKSTANQAQGMIVPRTFSASSEVSQVEIKTFSPEARLRLVISVLERLRDAECLHRVGKAFLQQSSLGTTTIQPASTANEQLVPWLVETLLEATCQAAQSGDENNTLGLLNLCHNLGGMAFADAVRSRGSRTKTWKGAKPVQLAEAAGHHRVVRLLQSWPDIEDTNSGGCTCVGLRRPPSSGSLSAFKSSKQIGAGVREKSLPQRIKGALSAAGGWRRGNRGYSKFGA